MTYLIAAAGTGGHVYPGLAVGEALLEAGVAGEDVIYVGGDRLESVVYPDHGFRFVGVELAGLKRSFTTDNLRLPVVVARARRLIGDLIDSEGVRAVLGMGGYVTVPAALAARSRRVPLFISEQNAEAGLANRLTRRWSRTCFVSFPNTIGLPGGRWSGNPVRRPFWEFDRPRLRDEAQRHYGISAGVPTLGVFGGSLGAGAINEAVAGLAREWSGEQIQIVHLTGDLHIEAMNAHGSSDRAQWVRLPFEDRMELFYAVADLVVARAGGAVAELTATATPAILVPGSFGSAGHQMSNARFLQDAGAAVIVEEEEIALLRDEVAALLTERARLGDMASAASAIAKPSAALTIATAMIEATR